MWFPSTNKVPLDVPTPDSIGGELKTSNTTKSSILACSRWESAASCAFCLSKISVEAVSANSFTAKDDSSPKRNKWYSGWCENPEKK